LQALKAQLRHAEHLEQGNSHLERASPAHAPMGCLVAVVAYLLPPQVQQGAVKYPFRMPTCP
jgi:hypothetical protein